MSPEEAKGLTAANLLSLLDGLGLVLVRRRDLEAAREALGDEDRQSNVGDGCRDILDVMLGGGKP